MPWARFDDRFHSNRKVRRAWKACPASVGLFSMAVTYSAGEMLDGFVPAEFAEQQFRRDKDEHAAVQALTDSGLWERVDDGFFIPAFLEFNESREQIEGRRASDAERKAAGRAEQARRRSRQRPAGQELDDAETPGGVSASSSGPDPTRPDPTVSSVDETEPREVVVVPPPPAVPAEIDRACDILATAGLLVHDRTAVQGLAEKHPKVDIEQAAIRCSEWLRSSPRKARHPIRALMPFLIAEDAPQRGAPPAPVRGRANLQPVVYDGPGTPPSGKPRERDWLDEAL